jgi:hypothetical protein
MTPLRGLPVAIVALARDPGCLRVVAGSGPGRRVGIPIPLAERRPRA